MKVVSVSGSPRGNVGKKDAKRLRREGQIPCVIYGGSEQINFFLPETSFKDIVYTPESCIVSLDIDGRKFESILQDIQFHPVNEGILHADFLEIFPDKPVKIKIPVKLSGTSPGVLKGGKLHLKLRKLLVMGLPADLPDQIDVSISKLNIGDSFKVGQLVKPKLNFLDHPASVVVMVKSTRAAAGAADEEETEDADTPAEDAVEAPTE